MRKIHKIEPLVPVLPTRKKVAAYARVSMETERLHHSLSAQISYYSELIQSNPEWEYAGVYADEFVTGTTTDKRSEFQRLLTDCEARKINIVLTKSISRFARNTVDLLETVRHLKELGVEVRFEKEKINSLSGDGEVMLTLLASFAQEEIISLSNNVKWGTRKRFEQGIPNGHFQIYGYRWDGDHLVIEPEEAKIVRLIFDNFLNGLSAESTEKQLEQMGVKSYKGKHFSNSSIRQILGDITYTGNLLFQKEYVVDPITKKSRINRGELPQYWAEDTHEAIIPMETYQAVQAEITRRRKLGVFANWSIPTTCFTSKIKCGNCGVSYRRSGKRQRKNSDMPYYVWVCQTYDRKGKTACDSKTIPEITLKNVCAEVLGLAEFDETVFSENIEKIVVIGSDQLDFHFTDGRIVHKKWKSNARKDCWTPEYRAAASRSRMGKNPRKNDQNPFTGYFRCPICGANFRRQTHKYKDGTMRIYWHCPNSTRCGNAAKPTEEIAKRMIAEVLGTEDFDEAAFHDGIDHIDLTGTYEATLHLNDGSQQVKTWERIPKKSYPHTDAYKQRMSQLSKVRWADDSFRQAMSENMKRIRSEKHWSSKRK